VWNDQIQAPRLCDKCPFSTKKYGLVARNVKKTTNTQTYRKICDIIRLHIIMRMVGSMKKHLIGLVGALVIGFTSVPYACSVNDRDWRLHTTKQSAQIAQTASGNCIEFFCYFHCLLDRGRVRSAALKFYFFSLSAIELFPYKEYSNVDYYRISFI
jgi:hypothetical protein